MTKQEAIAVLCDLQVYSVSSRMEKWKWKTKFHKVLLTNNYIMYQEADKTQHGQKKHSTVLQGGKQEAHEGIYALLAWLLWSFCIKSICILVIANIL